MGSSSVFPGETSLLPIKPPPAAPFQGRPGGSHVKWLFSFSVYRDFTLAVQTWSSAGAAILSSAAACCQEAASVGSLPAHWVRPQPGWRTVLGSDGERILPRSEERRKGRNSLKQESPRMAAAGQAAESREGQREGGEAQ